jgi:outer membrane lipoprotein-sorting protein
MKYSLIALLLLIAAFPSGSAQESEYPMMDKIAQKVIEKYQKSSCEELKAQKEQPPDPQQAATKQKVVGLLKNDPKMREQFFEQGRRANCQQTVRVRHGALIASHFE